MFCEPGGTDLKESLPGISMKAMSWGENSLLCQFHLRKGSVVPLHRHPQEQSGYLVSGRMRFSGEAGDFYAEPGSGWTFQGNVAHAAEVLEDSVAVEVFSPVRQDYLPK